MAYAQEEISAKKNIIVPLSKDLYTYENSLYSINFPSVFVTKPKFL